MIKKILFLLVIFVLMVASASPAAAEKPTEPNGNQNTTNPNHGNSNHENQGNPNHGNGGNSNNSGGNPNAASPNAQNPNQSASTNENVNLTDGNTSHGFDEFGYNRTARVFNGTYESWCAEKGLDCTSSPYANDKLIMKWNAEWDRGNAEGWAHPPYDAWENNQWNGKVPGGSGEVWHYKIVWVGPCGADGTLLENGGYCIWGQFEVIMDHGTAAGVHEWLAHAKPSGYGSYP